MSAYCILLFHRKKFFKKLKLMQIKNLSYFVNKEKGKSCVLVGGSNSAKDFDFKNFKGITICFGDAIIRFAKKIKPNYWIASNEFFPIPDINSHLKLINSSKATLLISNTNAYGGIRNLNIKNLSKKLKVNWFAWDHIHINKKPCYKRRKCCSFISKPETSITDAFCSYFHKKNFFKIPTGTIAIEALAFAVLLGCNKIYISGVDLPEYRNDHYSGIFSKNTTKVNKIIRRYLYDGIYDYKKIQLKEKKIFNYLKFYFYKKIGRFYQTLVDFKNSELKFKNFRLSSSFYQDRKNIMFNLNKIAKLTKSRNIKIYNVSKYSKLNEIKNIIKYY